MNAGGGVGQGGEAPPLPRSIWVLAWSSLAGQVVLFLQEGARDDNEVSLVVSVLLGGLLIGYVSAGVVRARTVRLGLAWVVLILGACVELLGLFVVEEGDVVLAALSFATTVVALAALTAFSRTHWFGWQRTKPPASHGPPIDRLVAMGVLVGVLGGIVGSTDDGVDARVGVEPQGPAGYGRP